MRQIGFGVRPVEKPAPVNMGYPQGQGKREKPPNKGEGETPTPNLFEQELEKQKATTI